MRKDKSVITKKLRFEVFKRDSFTCQYCGRSAPDVILQADHIVPVAKGGEADIVNLITSCFDCNAGKSDRELNDDTVIKKQKAQLDQLQERREQLEMMVEWQKGLLRLGDLEVDKTCEYWLELSPYAITEVGKSLLRDWIKRFGVSEVLESMRISFYQYVKTDNEGEAVKETVFKAFEYIPKICANRKRNAGKPYLNNLYYIRGILNNRLHYVNSWKAIDIMEAAYLAGVSIENIKTVALDCKNWTDFSETIEHLTEQELKQDE